MMRKTEFAILIIILLMAAGVFSVSAEPALQNETCKNIYYWIHGSGNGTVNLEYQNGSQWVQFQQGACIPSDAKIGISVGLGLNCTLENIAAEEIELGEGQDFLAPSPKNSYKFTHTIFTKESNNRFTFNTSQADDTNTIRFMITISSSGAYTLSPSSSDGGRLELKAGSGGLLLDIRRANEGDTIYAVPSPNSGTFLAGLYLLKENDSLPDGTPSISSDFEQTLYGYKFSMPAQNTRVYAVFRSKIPNASFTATGADSGTLTKVASGMQYSLDGGSRWTEISGTSVTIASGVTAANGIKVYQPQPGSSPSEENTQTITVTKAARPIVNVVWISGSEQILVTTSNNKPVEYRKSGESNWTEVSVSSGQARITGLEPGTYEVRVKASGTELASESLPATISVTYRIALNGNIYNVVNVPNYAKAGDVVQISTDMGYSPDIIKSAVCKGMDGTDVPVTKNNDRYAFTMPAQAVTVTVEIDLSYYLKKLEATPGTLTPALSRETTEYTIRVPSDVSEISLELESEGALSITSNQWKTVTETSDGNGTVRSVKGTIELDSGSKVINVTTSAANGVSTFVNYTITIIRHTHEWTYSAEGNVLTATCANSDGGHGTPLTAQLTLNAPNLTVYGGTSSPDATISGSIEGESNPPIVYKQGDYESLYSFGSAGTYTASITMGGATAEVAYTIAPRPVTITGLSAADKVYDGTVDADVTGTPVLNGVVEGEALEFKAGTAAFADKNVGNSKTVSFSGYELDGDPMLKANYTLSAQPADVTTSISPKSLTVTAAAVDRSYEQNNKNVTVTLSDLTGVIPGDDVSLASTSVTGTIEDDAVGTNKPVTLPALTLTGTDAANYTLTQPTDVTVNILEKTYMVSYYRLETDTEPIQRFTVNEGATHIVPDLTPDSLQYHSFVGWKYNNVIYTKNDEIQNITSDVNLYAQWMRDVIIYVVDMEHPETKIAGANVWLRIRSNGNTVRQWTSGTNAEVVTGLTAGTEYVLRVMNPLPSGYDSLGDEVFRVKADGTAEPVAGSWAAYVDENGDILLRLPKIYQVRYETNGGTINSGEVTQYTYSQSEILPTDVTNGNLRFGGWYENADFSGEKRDFITGSDTGGKTFYAKWEYTVKFDKNADDAQGTMADQVFVYGVEQTLPQNAFTREGYGFADWKIKGGASDGQAVADDYSASTLIPESGGIVTLTAQWEIGKYTVTYDFDGGTLTNWDTNIYTAISGPQGSTTGLKQTVTHGGTAANPGAPSKKNNSFSGWYLADAAYDFNAAVTSDITLKAQWDFDTFTVTWKNWDGTVLETDENVPYGTMPAYDGEAPVRPADAGNTYTFSGWNPEVEAVSADVTYTAVFTNTANTYTVTWKNWDGTVLETDENVPFGTMPSYDGEAPVRPADAGNTYTFSGWVPEVEAVSADVTYTAVFSGAAKTFNVTVTIEGNGTASASPASGPAGTVVKLTALADEGWAFKEWVAESGAVTVNGDQFVMGTADVVIRAVFEKPEPEEPLKLPVKVIHVNGESSHYGIPKDIKATNLTLTLHIMQEDSVASRAEVKMKAEPGGDGKFELPELEFKPSIPNFKNSWEHYSYDSVAISPDKIAAVIYGTAEELPAYHLDVKPEFNGTGYTVYVFWNKPLSHPLPEKIVVHALPEDEIGAYQLRDDGTKEYLLFHTYDICMSYLGREELCAGPERCYHK